LVAFSTARLASSNALVASNIRATHKTFAPDMASIILTTDRYQISRNMKRGVNGMHCSITTSGKPSQCRTPTRRAKRITSAVVLLVLLVTGPLVRAQTGQSTDFNLSRLGEAVKAINQGDLPAAESLLKSLLATSPRDADALNLLGVVRAQQQNAVEAERLFRLARAAAPTHVGVQLNLGKLLLTTNRTSEALQIFQSAHRLAPERTDINLHLATLHANTGDYQQALEYLRLIPRSAATDDYFPVLLRSLIGLNRLEEARQLASEFSELRSSNPEVQAEFALLLAKGGLSDQALILLEAARRQTPASFPVLYGLGIINASRKRYDKAEENLSEALKIKPDDVTTLRALANVARATGNLEKSLANLVEARRIAPDAPEVLYDFGVTALRMDLFLDAIPVFEQLHRAYPRQPAYLYALAAARWKKGETVETAQLMKSYVALQPRDASGFYLLGAALLRQELITEARAALQRSLSLKADPDTEYLIAVSFEKEGNRDAAVNIFRQVVHSRPDHAAAHAALGVAYREAGNYAEARIELERAVDLDPNDLRANYQLGLVYAKLGEKEAAKRMFARADDLRRRQRNQESVILKLIESPKL
jgi:tetratricopeptide (TPR) repeat protein